MLKKLLRYDMRAMFRYWWIAALSCVVFACAGGGCLSILLSDRSYPFFVTSMAGMGVALPIFGMSAFAILSSILVFIRFYRNFFTDEGYLTFTLPVGRHQLLNSKLISGTSLLAATIAVLLPSLLLMLAIGFGEYVFTPEFFREIGEALSDMWEAIGAWSILYAAELILLGLTTCLFGVLGLSVCITLASLLVKKAKVITAIAIYYGASSILSFVMQLLQLFGLPALADLLAGTSEAAAPGIMALLLLGGICFVAIFCGLLYLFQYRLLDRKLNLA
ncbi:MAG: hypothetical protein E7654_08340 [Ruminococcaceae bacterium]|nr:hypothetical protein [Oscillospiraceae bacterium]